MCVLSGDIVRFCEFKMLKLVPSRLYNHSNGLGRIMTSYFSGKSEVSLVMVIYRNAEVYPIYEQIMSSGMQANGMNLVS